MKRSIDAVNPECNSVYQGQQRSPNRPEEQETLPKPPRAEASPTRAAIEPLPEVLDDQNKWRNVDVPQEGLRIIGRPPGAASPTTTTSTHASMITTKTEISGPGRLPQGVTQPKAAGQMQVGPALQAGMLLPATPVMHPVAVAVQNMRSACVALLSAGMNWDEIASEMHRTGDWAEKRAKRERTEKVLQPAEGIKARHAEFRNVVQQFDRVSYGDRFPGEIMVRIFDTLFSDLNNLAKINPRACLRVLINMGRVNPYFARLIFDYIGRMHRTSREGLARYEMAILRRKQWDDFHVVGADRLHMAHARAVAPRWNLGNNGDWNENFWNVNPMSENPLMPWETPQNASYRMRQNGELQCQQEGRNLAIFENVDDITQVREGDFVQCKEISLNMGRLSDELRSPANPYIWLNQFPRLRVITLRSDLALRAVPAEVLNQIVRLIANFGAMEVVDTAAWEALKKSKSIRELAFTNMARFPEWVTFGDMNLSTLSNLILDKADVGDLPKTLKSLEIQCTEAALREISVWLPNLRQLDLQGDFSEFEWDAMQSMAGHAGAALLDLTVRHSGKPFNANALLEKLSTGVHMRKLHINNLAMNNIGLALLAEFVNNNADLQNLEINCEKGSLEGAASSMRMLVDALKRCDQLVHLQLRFTGRKPRPEIWKMLDELAHHPNLNQYVYSIGSELKRLKREAGV